VTVLVPCDEPKFAPAIVTEVPTGPLLGVKLVIVGGGGGTVNGTALLATPPTVTMTFPVVAPVGTSTVMLAAVQLLAVPAETPLNVTVLVPCDPPKFAPAIVTEVPTGPDVGLKEETYGGSVPLAALKAARRAPPLSEFDSVAPTDTAPAATWTASSVINFVFGAAGTRSSMLYPLPAVKVRPSAVVTSPRIKSPPTVVVAGPLFSVVPEPCAAAVTSMEFDAATPEYSRIANRSVLFARDSETVTVLPPAAMFSA
jgi:hypothetical protein